jgi:hypothetical protein
MSPLTVSPRSLRRWSPATKGRARSTAISAHERLADAVPLADLVTAEAERPESPMAPKMVRQRAGQPLESS